MSARLPGDRGVAPPAEIFSAVTILILLLGGIELIAIGIIGEYVGRIYDEVKGRPLYLVRARRNMPDAGFEPDLSSLPPVNVVPPRSAEDPRASGH